MLTFGYSNKYSGIVRSLAAIALAVLMFVVPNSAPAIVVKIFAVLLFVVGIATLVFGFTDRNSPYFPMWVTNSLMDVAISVLMFVFAEFVSSFVIYVVGVVLAVMGIWQTVVILSARRKIKFSMAPFIIPTILVAIFGAFLMIIPLSPVLKSSINIFVGVALLWYGITEMISSLKMARVIKQINEEATADEQDAVVEDATKEDSNL